ncbi:carbohydrate-binding protein [Chitinophaga arvensicola]|uniref:Fasciclin domain-containing protein n=1 Tax=Chitinophaga arvensicola TaxID=29529 RepID=A0A1I0S9U3_9BACT|nr:carbohydrate-binding protein [Chitinophaga arvensicola]SEW52991.1 Fasciclin domain-containing protein [Chitinophaga arvensicola]
MRKNIFRCGAVTGLVILFLYAGCKKDSGYYDHENVIHEFKGNTYEFLKSQTGVYDSFLLVIDRAGLTDSLKKGNYTVFAPTNASFSEAISNMNNLRKAQGRPLLYLSTAAANEMDSMVTRYIIPGIIPSDSMSKQDGIDMRGVRYNYRMHGRYVSTRSEGYTEGGPGIIEFSNTKNVIYTRQWSTSTTVTVDIKTTNGLVNVMDRNHIFGFDEFIGRINPTLPVPFNGYPLPIPGTISFDQFDKGGESVAYHDEDVRNNGGKYRPGEGVDIEDAGGGENGYDIGWTASGEWLAFTVFVNEPGPYHLYLKAASGKGAGEDAGTLHLEMDGDMVTNGIKIKGTGGNQNWYYNEIITRPLPAGKHLLKVQYDLANYNLRYMRFVPINNGPWPVPGTIPVEAFDPGGEGVGYHDADADNQPKKFRLNEGVDIGMAKEGGGYEVGWTNDGEWLNYTIDVKKAGDYFFSARLASPNEPNGGQRFHFEIDGQDVSGSMTCPNTGDWSNYRDITTPRTVHLEKGIHTMRFFLENGGYNIRSYKISEVN